MKNKKRMLAKELIRLLRGGENRKKLVEELVKVYNSPLLSGMVTNVADDNLDSIIESYTDEYEDRCSEKLLKALIKLYKSPVGREFLDNAPKLELELSKIGNEWTEMVLRIAAAEFQKQQAEAIQEVNLTDHAPPKGTKLH